MMRAQPISRGACRVGFRGKQIATITLVAAAVALATSVMNALAAARIAVGRAHDSTEVLAETLYHQARNVIRHHAGGDLRRALSEDPALRSCAQAIVGYSTTTLYAAIADESGTILFHSDPLQEGGRLGPADSIVELSRRSSWAQLRSLVGGGDVLAVDLPFRTGGEHPAGIVRVALSSVLLEREVVGVIARGAALATGVVVLVFLSSFYLANRLLAPLDVLRRELRRIDFGDAHPELELRSEEDVNRVAEFFADLGRRLAEDRRAARTEGAWLELMVRGLADAVLVVDRERHVVSLNEPAARMLGAERPALLGRPFEDVLGGAEPLRDLVERVLSSGTAVEDRAIDLEVDGQALPHAVTVQPLGEPAAEHGVMVTARDVEKYARLADHLSYTQKVTALGRLTSNVSHEIKNQLNGMILYVSLARDEEDAEKRLRHLGVLENEVRRLERVVEGFLRFTRPERLRLDELNAGELLQEALDGIAARAERSGIAIELSLEPGLPPIHGDRELLLQAASNLLLNACDAMPEGGRLQVGAARGGGGKTALVVEDSGIGIAPEVRDRIFDLYYTTKPDGNGVGLSLTYRIVHLHGGDIAVESTPGEGTRFTVTLPRVRA